MREILPIGLVLVLMAGCGHQETPFGVDMTALSQGSGEYVSLADMTYSDFDTTTAGTALDSQNDNSAPNFGNSTISRSNIAEGGGTNVRVRYTLGPNYANRYVFFQVISVATRDLSAYNAVRFKLKGSEHKVRIILRADAYASGNYDDYGFVIDATPGEWQEFTLFFADFKQEGWGTAMDFNGVLSNFDRLQFKASSMVAGETGWYAVDEIHFMKLLAKR